MIKENTVPYSSLKIFAHSKEIDKVKNGERTAPIYVRIKPTNKCNQNCYYCHYKNPYLMLGQYKATDEISWEKMQEIVRDFKDIGVKAVTFSGGGEPLLYPYIEQAMDRILEAGIDLSIITNGTMMNGKKAQILSKAKWVRISLESGCSETYSSIRGVQMEAFRDLCKNIEHFARIKEADCELGINFVVGPRNYKEVYQTGILMKNIGVNHIKYTALISNDTLEMHLPFKDTVIDQIHKMKKEETENFHVVNLYESDFDTNVVFGRNYDFCAIKDYVTVTAANSKIYYCHDKAYLSDGEVGDISQKSFKEVWFSDAVTKKFEAFNPQKSCRHSCVYDDRNEVLNKYYELNEQHINFI